ncbi:beta-defensin 114 [Erinaceus europaeus]|uniref:Beta-defensin n=1 Tax=Erinaceus europaeus TaxID=9365 RepID=A0A1S3WVA7_ERIEU|nr:beta-defensin 114 [Erinaceus europaeus]
MKISYYFLYFLCYVTFTLPAKSSLVDPDQCSKYMGYCKRRCAENEKRIDICLSPSKICCVERMVDDNIF